MTTLTPKWTDVAFWPEIKTLIRTGGKREKQIKQSTKQLKIK